MKLLIFLVAVFPLVLNAITWYPAPDWQDTPDPLASPNAKKGGTIRFNGSQAPKSLNAYIDNNTYTLMMFALMYEPLIATDTVTLEFCPALARKWAISDDGNEYTFVIDSRARWSDGVEVTAEDVKWTFDKVTATSADTGSWKVILGAFESPEIIDKYTIKFRKKGGNNKDWRDILHCGTFFIMPKHAFEGQDFNKLDLVGAPVGGPYMISRIAEQVETEFSRVKNWWRKDMVSCKYVCNFDRIVMRYYIDNENAFEALKKRTIDVYPVYTARIMAAETHGEKFDKNWILRRRITNHKPIGYQGFAMNLRRFPFNDLNTRKAMAMLIDRETMNRTMMFGEYFLQNSYFTDLYTAANPCKNEFYRYDIEKAKALLAEAGWKRNPKTGLLAKNGRDFKFKFLSRSGTEDKFLALFNHALMQCGIEMEIVRKDFAGWMRDMDSFNFEMTWASWGATVFRNLETSWLSSEADRRGSNNVTGFKSEAVDKIIADEKSMMNVEARANAYREVDRLVAAECPYAFLWNKADTKLLYWNKFGMPDNVLSRYGDEDSIFSYWWYDADKAEELAEAMAEGKCLPKITENINYDKVMKQ